MTKLMYKWTTKLMLRHQLQVVVAAAAGDIVVRFTDRDDVSPTNKRPIRCDAFAGVHTAETPAETVMLSVTDLADQLTALSFPHADQRLTDCSAGQRLQSPSVGSSHWRN
jgi:hypothetical protein